MPPTERTNDIREQLSEMSPKRLSEASGIQQENDGRTDLIYLASYPKKLSFIQLFVVLTTSHSPVTVQAGV